MDTDELSEAAYEAVIVAAERFDHNLTLQFGLLSEDCEDENDFLEKSLELIDELKNLDPEELNDVFFGELPNVSQLKKTLDQIAQNINKVKTLPHKKRRF